MPPIFHTDVVDYNAHIQQNQVQEVRSLHDDTEWLTRIQIDVKEHIRQLSNPEKREQALKNLKTFPFDDLLDPISTTLDLLNALIDSHEILDLLRKSIYSVIRKYIRSVRTPEIIKLIEELETCSAKRGTKDRFAAELDLCAALLGLLPDDLDMLEQVKSVLYPETTKRSAIKIIRLVTNMGIHWRRKWFPIIIKIEECFDKVMRKQEGLMELKEYIYHNYDADWRVMHIAFDCMQRIIFDNVSEDVRNSAYWEKMTKKNRIKIVSFADPTPILNMLGRCSPFLNTPSREAAVRFLIAMTKHPDEEIANDALRHISKYSRLEKDPSILLLYHNFNNPPSLHSKDSSVNETKDNPELSFPKIVGCLGLSKIPIEIIEQLLQSGSPNKDATSYFNIHDNFGTRNERFYKEFFENLTETEKLDVRKKTILLLTSLLHFQPRRPKTWFNTRLLVTQIAYQLDFYPEDQIPYAFKETLQKLKEFYEVTKNNEEKLNSYIQQLTALETRAQEEKMSTWRAHAPPSLLSDDYGIFFVRWKKDHDLESIKIESFVFKKTGHLEYTFKVTSLEGKVIRIKASQSEKGIDITLLENNSDIFNELIHKHRLPSYQNTFAKLDESLKKVIKKGCVEKSDSILVIDYFEELFCSRSPTLESITLSAVTFVSLFGFTLNGQTWGLPTLEELQEILDVKLRMSYLFHSYGSEHCESEYVAYCNQQRASGKLVLIPRTPFLPVGKNASDLVVEFYNLILQNDEAYYHPIIHNFSKIISALKDVSMPSKILYECSLAFQRILPKYSNISVFSVNRASIVLRTIIDRLSKTKICDLKLLIQGILAKTDPNVGNNKYKYSLSLIDSFNKIIRILFPINELSEADRQEIHAIYLMLTSHYNEIFNDYLGQPKHILKKTQAVFLKILCEFYTLSNYYGNTWSSFQPHVVNVLNVAYKANTFNTLELIQILIRSIIKFYILKRHHSNALIHTFCNFLYEIVGANHTNKNFLLEMTDVICSHSLIVLHTGLQKSLLNIFLKLITLYENGYTKEDAAYLIEILNTTTMIKQYLTPSQTPLNTKDFYDQAHLLWERAKNDTITHYIVPAWRSALEEGNHHQLRSILRLLSIKVKEDSAFLEALEVAYQKLIFANKNNPHTLQEIYTEISNRFHHIPIHKRIRGRLISTYKPDGSLFEEKYAYDILAVLLGVDNSSLSYLRLEDNRSYFLSALICPVKVKGQTYITGFGGGGKMKMKVNRHGVPDNALLPQINIKAITEGKFGKLLESVCFKEAYYYWQRMFNPTSLDGDVIVGTFKVMYVDPGTVVFGSIMPHDGFGVISERVLGHFKHQLDFREPYSVRTPIQTYQAVQHNKRSTDPSLFDASVEEFLQQSTQSIEEYLSANQSDQSSVKDLYSRLITGGVVNGRNFVAIPATGENHIILSLPVKQHDVWLGKTPYEKTSNVLLKHEDQISHLRSDDPQKRDEAVQLSKLTGFQYSFTATTGSALIFNKGILVIIPDEMWSYPGIDVIFCTKDNKVDSRWKTKKIQPYHGQQEYLKGVLTPTQKYGPGSFIAISPDIQIDRWNADYDGDIVTFEAKPKQTKQFQLMSKSSKATGYSVPKIPKTFTTPLMEDGSYNSFRFSSIVQSRTANLLTQYAKIYDVYIALRPEHQIIVAKTVVEMTATSKIIRCILVDESEETLQTLIKNNPGLIILKILSAGVKTGSDSFKSKVDWTFFREFGDILHEVYLSLNIPTELVYFKRLCIEMHRKPINFNSLMIDTHYQSKYFDSLPIHILYKTLAATPEYKMKRLSQLLLKQIETDETVREIFLLESKMHKQKQLRRNNRRAFTKQDKPQREQTAPVPLPRLTPLENRKADPPSPAKEPSKRDRWINTLFNKILKQASTLIRTPSVVDEAATSHEQPETPFHDDFYILEQYEDKVSLETAGLPMDYTHSNLMPVEQAAISMQSSLKDDFFSHPDNETRPLHVFMTEEKINITETTSIQNGDLLHIMDRTDETQKDQQQNVNAVSTSQTTDILEEKFDIPDTVKPHLENNPPALEPALDAHAAHQLSTETALSEEPPLTTTPEPALNLEGQASAKQSPGVAMVYTTPSIDRILDTAALHKSTMKMVFCSEQTLQAPMPVFTPTLRPLFRKDNPLPPLQPDLDFLAAQVNNLSAEVITRKRINRKDWLRTLLKK